MDQQESMDLDIMAVEVTVSKGLAPVAAAVILDILAEVVLVNKDLEEGQEGLDQVGSEVAIPVG